MRYPIHYSAVVVSLSLAIILAKLSHQRDPAQVPRQPIANNAPGSTVRAQARTSTAPNRWLESNGQQPVVEPMPESALPVRGAIESFDRWVEEYLNAPADAHARNLETTGESLALMRRSELAALIEQDPENALRHAVPFGKRMRLPQAIAQHLEERVNGLARFDVIAIVPEPGTPPPASGIERVVTLNDRSFRAFVYGRRLRQTSREDMPLHGIAIGNSLAVAESPVRVLEPGEEDDPSLPAPQNGSHCPVSNAEGIRTSGVQVGSDVFYLCQDGHIAAFQQELEGREAGLERFGGASAASGLVGTQGIKKVLLIRVLLSDEQQESISDAQADEMMQEVRRFFLANSYGALTLEHTILPAVRLPNSWDSYAAMSGSARFDAFLRDAGAAAAALVNLKDYDLYCVQHPLCPARAYVGRKGATLASAEPGVACHELGHNLGLWHANSWRTSDGSIIGPGANREYGNPFDTMGGGSGSLFHFNAYYKNVILNWLPDTAVKTVTEDGIYQLHPFDIQSLEEGRYYALRIRKDDQRDYWIETRRELQSDPLLAGSALLSWSPWGNLSANGTLLLDMLPGSRGAAYDAPLQQGQSFFDSELGLKIVVLPRGATDPEAVEVLVQHVHTFTVEAETVTLASPMITSRDNLASQGAYIYSPVPAQGSSTLTVTAPASGDYAVWCRVRSASQGFNPVTLSPLTMAAGAQSTDSAALWVEPEPGQWQWSRLVDGTLSTASGADPKRLALEEGANTLYLGLSPGIQIDCLLFTNDESQGAPVVFTEPSPQVATLGADHLVVPLNIVDPGETLRTSRVTITSSNPALVPDANIGWSEGAINPSLMITPLANRLGTTSIRVSVISEDGNSRSLTFDLTIMGVVQSLVNAAAPGEVVFIPPGTFVDQIVVDKDLILEGAGPSESVIDGAATYVPLTITKNATVVVRNLAFRNGVGGIRNSGNAAITHCAIQDNQAQGQGGGILNTKSGSLHVGNCTVSNNRCTGLNGGGIYNAGTLVLWNTTISGNSAAHSRSKTGAGGGIFNAGELTAYNCTIVRNVAPLGAGLAGSLTANLGSCILAENADYSQQNFDFQGQLNSLGHNLIQSPEGGILLGNTGMDMLGIDPRLGPLQDNGGGTWTHALLSDSPAIDRGNAADLTEDQRGSIRPRFSRRVPDEGTGDASDIGAFEFVPEGERELRLVTDSGSHSGKVAVRLLLDASGDENSFAFALAYAQDRLTNPRPGPGLDVRGARLEVGTDGSDAGTLKLSLSLNEGQVLSAGLRELVVIEFDQVAGMDDALAGIDFDDNPGSQAIRNAAGENLEGVYRGTVDPDTHEPRLTVETGTNGEPIVTLLDGEGYSWLLQASDDLANWQTIALISSVEGKVEFTDTSGGGSVRRFYRATRYALDSDPGQWAAGR